MQLVQVFHHAVKVHAARLFVEVAVGGGGHVDELQDAQVVRPSGVRHEYARIGVRQTDRFEALTDRTGTTGGRYRCDTVTGHSAIQNQIDHCIAERRIASKTGIGFGCLNLPQLFLGGLDCTHHGGDALGVFVNADAKVDLLVARILAVRLHQRQNFICGLGFEVGKHYASPVAIGRVGNAPHSAQEPSYRA